MKLVSWSACPDDMSKQLRNGLRHILVNILEMMKLGFSLPKTVVTKMERNLGMNLKCWTEIEAST